MQDQPVACI